VATFYAHFDVVNDGEPRPPAVTIRVCDSLSCMLAGAETLLQALQQDSPPSVRVVRAPCMGSCDTAPAVEVGHRHVDHATVDKIKAVVASDNTHPEIPPYQDFESYRAE